jgi:hypothetical protein
MNQVELHEKLFQWGCLTARLAAATSADCTVVAAMVQEAVWGIRMGCPVVSAAEKMCAFVQEFRHVSFWYSTSRVVPNAATFANLTTDLQTIPLRAFECGRCCGVAPIFRAGRSAAAMVALMARTRADRGQAGDLFAHFGVEIEARPAPAAVVDGRVCTTCGWLLRSDAGPKCPLCQPAQPMRC